jgi:hypothetical protein
VTRSKPVTDERLWNSVERESSQRSKAGPRAAEDLAAQIQQRRLRHPDVRARRVASRHAVHGGEHVRSTVDYVREGRKNNFDHPDEHAGE